MNDYIRYLLQDDVVESSGDIVWISTLSRSSPNVMGDEDKTAGFWAMPMDVRETLGDMVVRLAECIKRGERYPDEYRYTIDKVFQQQSLTDSETKNGLKSGLLGNLPDQVRDGIVTEMQIARINVYEEHGGDTLVNGHSSPRTVASAPSNMSELDQLFSKLSTSEPPKPDPTPPNADKHLSGKALLDTMFASVAAPTNQKPNQTGQKLTLQQLGLAPPVTSPPENMEIISPKPSAAGLPQILTADVIHGLMGLPTPESRSASRSSASASVLDHPRSPSSTGAHRSRERGYVADFGEDDGGTSEASTNADPVGPETGESILERLLPGARSSFLSAPNNNSIGSQRGDATPRARVEDLGHVSPPARSRPVFTQTTSETQAPVLRKGDQSSVNRTPGSSQQLLGSRTVSAPSSVPVPFQSGADLWPEIGRAHV